MFFHADYEYDVQIRLLDKRGKILISEKVYSAGFDRPFNLKNLPAGPYTFQVKYSSTKFEHGVTIAPPEELVLSKTRTPKEKKSKERKEPVLINEADGIVNIKVVDEEIKALGIFFYLNNTDEFEYFHWEPSTITEQSYKLSMFDASLLRVEVVEDGKILASTEITK